MLEEHSPECPLFGGAITCKFPQRLQDVSNIRQVPDHQEAFADPARDESLVFELLELKHDIDDAGSAAHFFLDLATEQAAGGFLTDSQSHAEDVAPTRSQLLHVPCHYSVSEQSGVFHADWLGYKNSPVAITTAVGQMDISKERQGREAQNRVRVYLANLRLKEVTADVLITAYEPIFINPLSVSAGAVGSGLVAPASRCGCMGMAEIFRLAVSTFRVHDWTLFGSH